MAWLEQKLYPPQIEGGLPAFYYKENKEYVELQVPFTMNKSVGWADIERKYAEKLYGGIFHIQIKDLENNQIKFSIDSWAYDKENQIAIFGIHKNQADEKLIIGNFYKIQIAYNNIKDLEEDENNVLQPTEKIVGYYSTVGIAKYTTEPEVSVSGFKKVGNNIVKANQEFIGEYSQKDKDFTEKIYSYNFAIYKRLPDEEENNEIEYKLVYQTDEIIHNHENDDRINSSEDVWYLPFEYSSYYEDDDEIIKQIWYYIVYSVTTANGIQKSSDYYQIAFESETKNTNIAKIDLSNNQENGFVELDIALRREKDNIDKISIYRTNITNYQNDKQMLWEHIHELSLTNFNNFLNYQWRDYTVESGQIYKYKILFYIEDTINSVFSNEILVNFHHIFLYDGERQLKIKFNPKISSFKETLMESKTNTLGGKYPLFFRNGQVSYKEFPISGLISYQMDEMELFLTDKEMMLDDNININNLHRPYTIRNNITASQYWEQEDSNSTTYLSYLDKDKKDSSYNQITKAKLRTTNLVDYNIVAEKIFKLKVLEFLNNGKPKLFKSPIEGNYLVRLMNSSLSPNDQLGRMLHTFSTTATEIDECSLKKLNEYNIINLTSSKMSIVNSVTEYMPYGIEAKKFYYYFPPGKDHLVSLQIELSNSVESGLIELYYNSELNKEQNIEIEEKESSQVIFIDLTTNSNYRYINSIWISVKSPLDRILLTYKYVSNYASI